MSIKSFSQGNCIFLFHINCLLEVIILCFIQAQPTEASKAEPTRFFSLKYISLLLLIVQNTTVVLLMRYSRTMSGPRYLTSTAVVIAEIMKFVTCFFLVLHGNQWALLDTLRLLRYEIIEKYTETLKVSIPSFLYTLQNNLIYISLNYLDAATFQVSD